MKKFLAVYLGSEQAMSKWANLSEAERQERQKEGIRLWSAWAEKNAKVIKDGGSPLGKTKRINEKGISDTRNQLTAYTVVEAETHEDAAKLFLNHPHFEIFPGDSIEVMEFLPIPTK